MLEQGHLQIRLFFWHLFPFIAKSWIYLCKGFSSIVTPTTVQKRPGAVKISLKVEKMGFFVAIFALFYSLSENFQ